MTLMHECKKQFKVNSYQVYDILKLLNIKCNDIYIPNKKIIDIILNEQAQFINRETWFNDGHYHILFGNDYDIPNEGNEVKLN